MMKVFLVDDEIAIRENLRTSFPWEEEGFMLVGEAPDGEMALPMIRDLNPDILLTDIRMPFMDGIRLCREVHRTMPWVGMIILSGYDDFSYAQQAISLGVREYLLKPVTPRDLAKALHRVEEALVQERRERESMDALRRRMASGNQFLREKLLASLFTEEGDRYEDEALISQMREMGVNLAANCYAVIDISFQAEEDQRAGCRAALSALAEASGGGVLTCSAAKGARALVMGDNEKDTEERAYSFAQSASQLPELAACRKLLLAIGETVNDYYEIRQSAQSARHVRDMANARGIRQTIVGRDFEASPVVKARQYLSRHFANPDLMLQDVADAIGLSQSHFSTVFAQETGTTYTQYLTDLRMNRARELLRETGMRSVEIAALVGYHDAHYFSYLFKKNTGMTPGEYRRSVKNQTKTQ